MSPHAWHTKAKDSSLCQPLLGCGPESKEALRFPGHSHILHICYVLLQPCMARLKIYADSWHGYGMPNESQDAHSAAKKSEPVGCASLRERAMLRGAPVSAGHSDAVMRAHNVEGTPMDSKGLQSPTQRERTPIPGTSLIKVDFRGPKGPEGPPKDSKGFQGTPRDSK